MFFFVSNSNSCNPCIYRTLLQMTNKTGNMFRHDCASLYCYNIEHRVEYSEIANRINFVPFIVFRLKHFHFIQRRCNMRYIIYFFQYNKQRKKRKFCEVWTQIIKLFSVNRNRRSYGSFRFTSLFRIDVTDYKTNTEIHTSSFFFIKFLSYVFLIFLNETLKFLREQYKNSA